VAQTLIGCLQSAQNEALKRCAVLKPTLCVAAIASMESKMAGRGRPPARPQILLAARSDRRIWAAATPYLAEIGHISAFFRFGQVRRSGNANCLYSGHLSEVSTTAVFRKLKADGHFDSASIDFSPFWVCVHATTKVGKIKTRV
jgi:hypothetical protein